MALDRHDSGKHVQRIPSCRILTNEEVVMRWEMRTNPLDQLYFIQGFETSIKYFTPLFLIVKNT